MDPAIKQGFVIGLVIAAAAGYFGWREGWWPPKAVTALTEPAKPGEKRAETPPAAKSEPATPPAEAAKPQQDAGAPKPAPEAPAASADAKAAGTPPAAGSAAEKGAFDIVRVEPTGEAVVAGRCAANCEVELKSNGKTIDTARADSSGNWAMTPPQLPPGDHELGLAVKEPNGETAKSEQSVTVSVPETPKGEVVVVLNEPNAPSKILQKPGQEPAAAAPADQTAAREPGATAAPEPKTPAQKLAAVSIGAVDAEKGRLFVQGTAPAGATLRVYLNNALIAEPIAGGDERWSVRVEKGLSPGDYAARVDHVEGSGKVVARAEARFTYQGEVAESGAKAAEPAAPKSAQAPAAEPQQQAATPAAGEAKAAAEAPGGKPSSDGGKSTAAEQGASNPSVQPGQSEPDRPTASQPSAEAKAETPASPSKPETGEASRNAAAQAEKSGDAANPVVASIETANVSRGDSLWRISRKTYGAGMRYTVIFTANDKQIRDPNLIYPGQVLVLPPDPSKGAASAR